MPAGSYVRTEENREKMRILNLGRKHSLETRAKMSLKRKLRTGEKSPNFGKEHSEEVKEKIRLKMIGRNVTEETCQKISNSLKGKKKTKEHIEKFKLSVKGRKPWNKGITHSDFTKEKLRDINLGLKRGPHKLETKIKMRESGKRNRESHWNWKGGIGEENKNERKTLEYRIWRQAVFTRDNYTCVLCTKKGGRLNADHIKPFSVYKELRLNLDNGRTLCVECHRKTDTFGWSLKHSITHKK